MELPGMLCTAMTFQEIPRILSHVPGLMVQARHLWIPSEGVMLQGRLV